MAYKTTKRPQNRCKSCGYTWYPRGKSLSPKCPNCGSGETRIVGTGLIAGLIMLGVIAAIFGHSNSGHTPTREPTIPVATEASGTDAASSVGAQSEASTDVASVPIAVGTATDEQVPVAASSVSTVPAQVEAASPDPTSSPDIGQIAPATKAPAADTRRTYQTSFACTQATLPDEIAVCSDPGLAAMDVELAAYYSNFLKQNVDQQALVQSQQTWLQGRHACGADLDCLRHSYGVRLGQMHDMSQ